MIPDLQHLAANAKTWAAAYTSVVEALMMEGVPEIIARAEARSAANFALFCVVDADDEDFLGDDSHDAG